MRATHDFLTEADIQYYKPLILQQYLNAVELWCIRIEGGGILGFLGISPGKIEMLFLRPAARGQGLGKILLEFAINAQQITQVDVNEQNHQALGFYEHAGFKVISRSELDGSGKPYPILSLELK